MWLACNFKFMKQNFPFNTFRPPITMRWLILTVNLMGFIITMETCLWACLWGIFWIRLIEVGRPTINVGITILWTGFLDWMRKENGRWVEHWLFSASWLQRPCDQAAQAPDCHDRPDLQLWVQIDLFFLRFIVPRTLSQQQKSNTDITGSKNTEKGGLEDRNQLKGSLHVWNRSISHLCCEQNSIE